MALCAWAEVGLKSTEVTSQLEICGDVADEG